jgi:hypothetical protein
LTDSPRLLDRREQPVADTLVAPLAVVVRDIFRYEPTIVSSLDFSKPLLNMRYALCARIRCQEVHEHIGLLDRELDADDATWASLSSRQGSRSVADVGQPGRALAVNRTSSASMSQVAGVSPVNCNVLRRSDHGPVA